jgi:glutamate carboxypeptidase
MTTPLHTQFEEYLTQNLPDYLEMLRQMVAINSFTPNPAGVDALGQLTAVQFASLGFTAETVPSAHPEFGHHLVLTRLGQSGRKIGLVSHLDTVFPPEEEIRNDFHWREVGDRIYGPGTVDIKGGTVLIYMMLAAFQAIKPDLFDDITWVVLLDASEEQDGEDFGQLCRERLAGDTRACLIFEGGKVEGKDHWVVVARKGMAIYRVTAEGKASHAGSAHEKGANAIVQLADAIQRINGFVDYDRALTFNVGTVQGGTVTNRVPHRAMTEVEMRAFASDVYDSGVAAMLALPETAAVHSADGSFTCTLDVSITRKTAPWPRNEGTDGLLAIWQAAAAEIGVRIVPEERGGLSDGNYFWDEIPTLDGLGVSGANAHCSERSEDGSKDQEFCEVSSFVSKAVLNATAVVKLLQGG